MENLENYREVTLESLANGALEELFQHEMKGVLANIQDPNTNPVTSRKLTMEVTFTPTPDRSMVAISLQVSSKQAPFKAVNDTLFLANRGGKITAYRHDLQQSAMEFDHNVVPLGEKKND